MPKPLHILIVESPYYKDITEELIKGAVAVLEEAGATYERLDVPGAFEIPAAIRFAEDSDQVFDGYIGLGCVIRGETSHYDYVCGESARGLQELAIKDRLAIGYGVLTVENRDQAWARASVDKGNKGGFVAEVALRMIELKQKFGLTT
ncbi:6,7-dimethyl-8-ribityllumazine synthase [Paremcibacter congregatus]|uniref:6,7-dimethyl-8-ribityllumazine synthase n=1 Tax=Paremcibacter congregatus TaxID=2043170 RepID=A0A2G4YN22_9PROT|nr:6,7-dimethyl-8-ribityllumazine synthase [Paremcibacter congregatus]PHZ83710.1 6,7-dimethyl-8-ribityllumazine synthase [Paremcibacter congregatus]QDE27412.1 6,7-dimethyl-8-ribityllumazine synthase [Paremcibacter congregatus]